MLNIVNAPNPVLAQVAKKIPKVNKAVLKLIKEMEQTLLSANDPIGVGLAAPQVGVSLQLFITKPTSKSKIQVFINPKIISKTIHKTKISHLTIGSDRVQLLNASSSNKSSDTKTKLEGCLSLPNIWGEVRRDPEIKLQYQQITNNRELITEARTFSGFMATIIQHEVDHLDGVLFPKRVLEQKGILYKSHKNEKNEDEFEEIEI